MKFVNLIMIVWEKVWGYNNEVDMFWTIKDKLFLCIEVLFEVNNWIVEDDYINDSEVWKKAWCARFPSNIGENGNKKEFENSDGMKKKKARENERKKVQSSSS